MLNHRYGISITFETISQVTATYGMSFDGTPASTPLCVVILSGTFPNPGGPYLGPTVGSLTPPMVIHQADMIFDGYTGNLLADSIG